MQVKGAEVAQLRKRVARPARASPRFKGPQPLSASSLNSRSASEGLSDARLFALGRVREMELQGRGTRIDIVQAWLARAAHPDPQLRRLRLISL